MPVEVTARHMRAKDAIHTYAEAKAQDLMDRFPGVEHVHVILDQEKHANVVEVVVQAKRHVHVEAKDSSDNLRTALDAAIDKAEKQLRKVMDKVHDHRVKGVGKAAAKPEAGDLEGGIL
jgi:ribosomal subunit interface protein